MFLKHAVIFSICISFFFSVKLYAKEREDDTIKDTVIFHSETDSIHVWKPCTSAYIELLGKGFISLNVDFRRKESYAISFGLQPVEGFMPNFMYYHFSGKQRRFELGGGFSGGFNHEFRLKGMLIHGVIGYRAQKKKGLIFRAGFTPLYVIFFDEEDKNKSNKLIPLVGLSLGYSF